MSDRCGRPGQFSTNRYVLLLAFDRISSEIDLYDVNGHWEG